MLEMAMAMPLLILMLLGTLEFGLMFSRYQMILASAHSGARVAALYRPNCRPPLVKREVDQAVTATANQLGIIILPTSVRVVGACGGLFNPLVRVTVEFDHFLTLVRGFLPGNFRVPLRATVTMRNE